MRVLLLNTYDLRGGAARATWRLFQGLKLLPVEPILLVQEKRSNDPGVIRASSPISGLLNPFRPYLDFAIPLLQTRQRVLFSTALIPDQIIDLINQLKPDVVHLNWITGGFIRLENLAKIKCPVVWTLHDMWALTGGCNYDDESLQARWRNGYTAAKPDGMRWDVERWVWGRKTQSWTSARHLITPSTWLAQLASHSEVVADWPVHVIPNALDTHAFSPGDSAAARLRFGIDPAARVALVALGGDLADPRKGLDLLRDALTRMGDTNDEHPFELMVVGRGTAPDGWGAGLPRTHWLGFVDDDAIVDAYRAADVVVVPSRQDNLPQTATEPHACGTPVVAFRIGGLPDIVDDRVTGYLAAPGDSQDLANGITWVLADEARRASLGAAARQRALDLWDARIVGAAHARLFAEIAQDRH